MQKGCFLSVVVPMYNEEEVIEVTYRRLKTVLDKLGETYEIVFVNDGSRDRTADIVRSLCAEDRRVKLVEFSRNFGHQIAVTAGMDHASGRTVVLIDADLQDPPELIADMVAKWREGYDVVYGKRIERKGESWFKKLTAAAFYRLLRSMTSVNIPVDTGDFRLMDRKVSDALTSMRERSRFIRGLVSWAGFKQTSVDYVRDERFAGETKYPLRKMIRLSLDAMTSFSTRPLKIASVLGFVLSAVGFVYLFVVLYQRLFTDTTTQGWTSMIAISLLFHGITLSLLGVLGEYIGRTYEESKGRPLYLVAEAVNFGEETEISREREAAGTIR
ncbi:glycosyltransferase [Cohnella sp. CIP 111063]|uniref:glycosyltransferase family 2 protein n=1 Tax=unclassified Cohnella TaxID=2636738 RepID=UPI000B8C3424|nr:MULTISPECIES: glycosyltransferase family 2 protein [unclassified Cohnella]OXS56154.1 glycosyltransferase [Cohnella sp. CIP 111063]PRX67788.1 dolichol-phosphate mannosyltransferase [Cohnella sp. SGD-V74]